MKRSLSIIRILRLRILRWVGHVARMRETRNACIIFSVETSWRISTWNIEYMGKSYYDEN
jgi:hypothetical protein